MKRKFKSISELASVAIAASSLCIVGSVCAVEDTSTASNPHLRSSQKSVTTTANAPTGKQLSAKDKSFMMNAAKGGMMEVDWGKLATQNGQNADVKKFGERMVTDHSKANNELMALAKEEGVSLPAAKAPGKWKSDKDYMDMMVKDHQKDLAEFEGEARDGTDPDLKKFAEKTAQVVSKHLALAQEVQGKVK